MSSSPPASAVPGSSPPRNPWIVDWKQDLLWFIAPPLLLVPLFALLRLRVPLEQLSLLVVTFGAVGHHLPGMLRAYGDAELFAQYRVRFIAAPLFLVTVCIAYSFYRPDALAIVVVAWGFWHSQAQVYGFLRIYDSKVGHTAPPAPWLDRFVCVSWFAGGIVMSDGRVVDFLKVYYRSGGPPISAGAIVALQTGMLALMGCSLLLYLWHLLRNGMRGQPPSAVKHAALVLSVGFWWYCMVGIQNVVLGVALYEVFHDVQYLAIVWFFNRRRAAAGPAAGRFTQFLFRPRTRFVVLYVGLVLAYGACSLLTRSLDRSLVKTVLTGLFAASGLLHFYYDGFIWRIRDGRTGQTLGVKGSQEGRGRLLPDRRGVRHAVLWAAFVIPLAVFGLTPAAADVHGMIVRTLPDSAAAHYNVALDLHQRGELDQSEEHLRAALEHHPEWPEALTLYGQIALSRGQAAEAVAYLERSIALEPLNAIAQFNLGDALIQSQRIPEGVAAYDEAIRIDSDFEASAYNNLGAAMLDAGAPADAEASFRRAIEVDPDNADAALNLARALQQQGRVTPAVAVYEQVLADHPENSEAYASLARLLIVASRWQQAETVIAEFAQRFPEDPHPYSLAGLLRLEQRQFDVAEAEFHRSLELAPDHFPALYGRCAARLERGQIDECLELIETIRSTQTLRASERQMLATLQRRANRQLSQRAGAVP